MCDVMEKYNREAVLENNKESIAEMLKDSVPCEKICQYLHITEDIVKSVEASLVSKNQ